MTIIQSRLDYEVPEIFNRHIGVWQGTVIKVNPQGERQRSFHGTFAVSIDGYDYHQVNTYILPDGNVRILRFEGRFENGVLILSSADYPEFAATAWDAGNEIILFSSSKIEEGKRYTYVETMTLTGANSRVRSTQIFQAGVFDGITYIEETRQEQVI
ncbi:DUF3598 family protein [Pleurocapsales cyanobacterium LEGE 06147]|nr:DUF3598 family protein [Pleurocapsales cyanobacterium LEGE 06147]